MRETLDFFSVKQRELAAKSGLSLKTIENYIKKESSIPSADKAVLIAQALGVSVEYLVTGRKDKKPDITDNAKNRELLLTLSKLNNYNYEIIVSMANVLLNLQIQKKSTKL